MQNNYVLHHSISFSSLYYTGRSAFRKVPFRRAHAKQAKKSGSDGKISDPPSMIAACYHALLAATGRLLYNGGNDKGQKEVTPDVKRKH